MKQKNKYHLTCVVCGYIIEDFATWFSLKQCCPKCGSKHSELTYKADYQNLKSLFSGKPDSFWHYFDFLPLMNRNHIVSCNEGAIRLERWSFLEEYAKDTQGIDCKIYVYRNDLNGGTHSFKDIAASMAASIFKENGIRQYCIASTGNTATAYGKYLAIAGINAAIFMPDNAIEVSQAEISAYGQQVYHVKGDYTYAKRVAADYATKFNILISTGNIDPIRIESKRTMVFEWLRMLGKMPDVYVQAISGGTGPLALDKAVRELNAHLPASVKLPKMLMVQTDKCDPMVQAWEKAKSQGFPAGFEQDYPVIDNPQTEISILATGNPATYPLIAKLIQRSQGDFIRVLESKIVDIARIISFERKTHIGPASAVCFLGLIEAVKQKQICNGQTVLVNMGEGVKRAPEFLKRLAYGIKGISSAEECEVPRMKNHRKFLYQL
jgi:threonine synthase